MNAWPSAVRDPRIDTLRGLFLVVMMVDHLPHHPLLHFTVQSFGFVSPAEGFVFVSGFVCAWVYGRILVKDGEAALRRRAWHRARDIYLTHVVLYTLVLLGGQWGGQQIASRFPDFWTGWWHGALLIYQPPVFGILPMYVVFLLLTPLLLEHMARGRALLIGSASVALWLAAQSGIGSPAHNPSWLQLGFFNILAWQLLFVAGAYFGYGKAVRLSSPLPGSRLLLVFSVVLAALFFLARHRLLLVANLKPVDIQTALQAWRSTSHPLRLINFAAFAYILWSLPRSIDKKLHGLSAFRFLRYLGQHSLQVFAWSVLVSYTASSFKVSWAALSPAWRTLLAVAAAQSLVIPAWLHERWTLRRATIFSLTTAKTNAPAEMPLAAAGANDLSLPADGKA
jgi:hypothetical protein